MVFKVKVLVEVLYMKQISVANQFSEFPAGRIPDDGPNSGERFREEFLVPSLREGNEVIEINLDDTLGYGSSFLDEAFAGLIRVHHFEKKELLSRLKFVDSRVIYQQMILQYIDEEAARAG
jgi:hypothetical protein